MDGNALPAEDYVRDMEVMDGVDYDRKTYAETTESMAVLATHTVGYIRERPGSQGPRPAQHARRCPPARAIRPIPATGIKSDSE